MFEKLKPKPKSKHTKKKVAIGVTAVGAVVAAGIAKQRAK